MVERVSLVSIGLGYLPPAWRVICSEAIKVFQKYLFRRWKCTVLSCLDWGGEFVYLQWEFSCLQSFEVLIRRTFPLQSVSKKAPTVRKMLKL